MTDLFPEVTWLLLDSQVAWNKDDKRNRISHEYIPKNQQMVCCIWAKKLFAKEPAPSIVCIVNKLYMWTFMSYAFLKILEIQKYILKY